MNHIDILGYIAGTLTTVSFLPQVIKTWKTRSTKDISLTMFLLFAAGVALWMGYGIVVKALPVVMTNAVTFVLVAVILWLKIKHR